MTRRPTVEVFVLCYSFDRIGFAEEAIRSVTNQTYPNVRIIVSDNSPDDRIERHLRREFPSLEIRRRIPSQAPYDHFYMIVKEADAPYFMSFHDDDLLGPHYIEELVAHLDANPRASCACANAYVLFDQTKTTKLFNPTLKDDIHLSAQEIAIRYLDHAFGVNPLPGYLFRTSVIQNMQFNVNEGGQYSDVTLLVKLATQGKVLWLKKPLMYYRKHPGNASGAISIRATKQVIRFLIRERILPEHSPYLRRFRFWNHLFLIRNRWRDGKTTRLKHLALVIQYFALHPGPLFSKLLQKLAPH